MLDKEQLLLDLKKDNIILSMDELNEVIGIYNNILDFTLEYDWQTGDDRFCFIGTKIKPFCAVIDDDVEYKPYLFYNIFSGIAQLKKYNLLSHLDYSMLVRKFRKSSTDGRSFLFELSLYISYVVSGYCIHKKAREFGIEFIDFFPTIVDHEINLISEVIYGYHQRNKNWILKSKFVPNKYKEILETFEETFDIYYDKYDYYDEINGIEYNQFLDMVYYYFLRNDLINKEPDKVLDFLRSLSENISDYVEALGLMGLNRPLDMFPYIDRLYTESKDKVVIR